ncbi:FAR-17a/AIG1-like protein [Xylariaceae sp. FL1272]|nr:FAR-17a/AIG1-like protein [Xylariaceae sp. FL1272]
MARHPLQKCASPSRRFSVAWHAAGIASFVASFRFLNAWETPVSAAYGGHYQFLTILGLGLALATFVVALMADLTLSPALFHAKNMLAVASAPLECLIHSRISMLYWGLRAIDKNLVLPPDFQLNFLPDFGFHAAPSLFLAADLFLLSPPWTITGVAAMALSQALAFSYWYWVEYCYSKNGWYPYPIFDILSNWERAALFTMSATLMAASTVLLKGLYAWINGRDDPPRDPR